MTLVETLLSPQAWLFALVIFIARMVYVALDMLRFLLTFRGKMTLAWIFGFFESIIYILIIGSVLTDIQNPLNLISYAAGFATGNALGAAIEKRMAIGFSKFSIISTHHSTEVAHALRSAGYGATEIPAKGRESNFMLIDCHVRRKEAKEVEALVLKIDPEAFITIEDVVPRQSGIWRP